MDQPNFAAITPLLHASRVEGDVLVCTFRCPLSGDTFEGRASLRGDDGADEVTGGFADGMLPGLRYRMGTLIRRWLGGRRDPASAGEGADRTEAAVIAAFHSVEPGLVWDASRGQWISARVAVGIVPEFVRQVAEFPVEARYDQLILARMLAEIASADGSLAGEERALLEAFIPGDLVTVDEVVLGPRLTAPELMETSSPGVRETLLMIAWAVALTDEALDPAEEQRLRELAEGLGLSAASAAELRHYAEVFVVDQALARVWPGGGYDPARWEEVHDLALAMGLDEETFSRIDLRFRRRNGLG